MLHLVSRVLIGVLLGAFALPFAARGQDFVPVAAPAIAAHVSFSLGASWVDADMDGDLDLFVVTGFSASNDNVLYRNDAGTFVAIAGIALAQDAAETACSSWADYDNDGDVDAYVSNLVDDGGMLYDGQGGGDLTLDSGAGLGGASQQGTGCAWGDYDNDGFVDLIIAALNPTIPTPNRLFHNDGDGTFTEVVDGPLGSTLDSHHHPTWSDYDGDGDLDLFFATGPVGSRDTDRMYRNLLKESGTATFQPITTAPIATETRDSQGLVWVDYDNDGDLDLYAVNYTSVPNQLYRNNGNGTFTKIVSGTIVTDLGAAHGVAWGDYDNDGDLDVYVARDLQQNNRYYRNEGSGVFAGISTGAFVNEGLSNYGVAAGDYDQDGDLDLFVPTARSEAASLLFRNDLASGAHWLVVRCEGTRSNRSAIGAKVRVRAVIGGTPRWQMREILASGGYGGHGALEAHFGLGSATTADSVRIEWPSGIVNVLTGVSGDRRIFALEYEPASVAEPFEVASLALACAPNPFQGRAALRFRLPRAADVTIELLDLSGRRVWKATPGTLAAGDHAIELDAGAPDRAGVFWARLTAGPWSVARRVVRLR